MRTPGTSLVELLACLAVGVVLAAVAAPGLSQLTRQSLAAGTSNQLLALMNHARSEAVMRKRSTGVCPSVDGVSCLKTLEWSRGVLSWVDENHDGLRDDNERIIRVMDAREFRGQRLIGATGRSHLGFRADGRSAGRNATLTLCGRDKALIRRIIVSNGGRSRIESSRRREPCPPGP